MVTPSETTAGDGSESETPRIVALVLAGGTGSRLYPASRSTRPKQFLPLLGPETLLERTVDRADFADRVVVSTRSTYEADVRGLLDTVDDVVVEPAAKDTGPALAYATHAIEDAYGDDVAVVVLPSDHHVGDDDAFAATMRRGARVARETGRLVAFGVDPTRPDTGYGYIEPGTDRGDFFELAAFHEKPDAETAERYVDAGYRWNAGTFAWTPRAFRAAARDSPLGPLIEALDEGRVEEGFDAVEPTSVDYAVMERVDDAAVVSLDVAWDDLGSWDAMARVLDPDADGNVVRTGADDRSDDELSGDGREGDDPGALFVDSAENVVVTDGTHVSLVGVDGLAVVAWDDRVLVVPTDEAQRVRDVVARLKERGAF
ncbi:mannose-1-phosphate guanylyltransferase [Salinigranum salinum]|uniref:mannose-1-phosphate guanylyltransferase n=1 Tax=Salinigranum salinum TaxID=1364937 RepID=UPI001F033310|nr:sugar phosphate nucleotidyltransferase [Salinigranum salinum]